MLALAALLALSHTSDTAEVPFRLAENAIIVDATVNQRKLSLMFDTGFGGAVLADSNIDLGPSDGSMTLKDFVGEFQAKTVKIEHLEMGAQNIELSNPEAIQQPIGHMSLSYNMHTDGILGFGAIQSRVTEINFENKKFIFHPDSYDISQRTPDNKRTFLLKMLATGFNSVELPVLTPSGRKMVLALDTGNAYYATTHRDVLERVGLWDSSRTPKFMEESWVASGPVPTWYKKMDGLTIFGVPVPTSYWDVIDLPAASAEGDGTVGIQFLQNFNITIDYNRRRVWLENFTGKVANDPEGDVGIAATGERKGGSVVVRKVSPDTPADKAGIKTGDRILEIDGTETSGTMTFRQVEAKLKGKPGTSVSVAVSHDGTLTRYDLKRAALIND